MKFESNDKNNTGTTTTAAEAAVHAAVSQAAIYSVFVLVINAQPTPIAQENKTPPAYGLLAKLNAYSSTSKK
jgi:hypothetical protein